MWGQCPGMGKRRTLHVRMTFHVQDGTSLFRPLGKGKGVMVTSNWPLPVTISLLDQVGRAPWDHMAC